MIATPDIATKQLTSDEERALIALTPKYKVILHNDEVHNMHEVMEALMKGAYLTAQQAELVMKEAHDTGKAIVAIKPREVAELYKERLETFTLTISLERD